MLFISCVYLLLLHHKCYNDDDLDNNELMNDEQWCLRRLLYPNITDTNRHYQQTQTHAINTIIFLSFHEETLFRSKDTNK